MNRINEIFSTPQEACAAVGAVYEDRLKAGKYVPLDDEVKHRRNGDCRGYLFPDLTGGLIFSWRLDACALWFVGADVRKLTPIERFRLFERARLSVAQADEERRKEEERAATVAEAVMREATPATECGHPYLKRKHVIPVAPLGVLDADRINEIDRSLRPDAPFRLWNPKRREPMRGPVLCVPYFLYGKTLSSVEFISEDGGKCSLKGGRMRGAYWAPDGLADEVRARGRVAVAEGLATALSVSQAAEIPCVSARSCSGLMSTAESLRRRFRKAERFVCSDVGNGEKQAREAARATGAKIAKPDFEERLIERFRALTGSNDAPTDFNDFYLARGDI